MGACAVSLFLVLTLRGSIAFRQKQKEQREHQVQGSINQGFSKEIHFTTVVVDGATVH